MKPPYQIEKTPEGCRCIDTVLPYVRMVEAELARDDADSDTFVGHRAVDVLNLLLAAGWAPPVFQYPQPAAVFLSYEDDSSLDVTAPDEGDPIQDNV